MRKHDRISEISTQEIIVQWTLKSEVATSKHVKTMAPQIQH